MEIHFVDEQGRPQRHEVSEVQLIFRDGSRQVMASEFGGDLELEGDLAQGNAEVDGGVVQLKIDD